MDRQLAIATARRESQRATYEGFQGIGVVAVVVGSLLAAFSAVLVVLLWLDVPGLGKVWEWRAAWSGLAALVLLLTGVVAKSYGNRATRMIERRAAPTTASSTLVVARECTACRTLNAVDRATCTRCDAAL